MRFWWHVCILAPLLAFAATDRFLEQPDLAPLPGQAPGDSQQYPLGRKADRLPIYRSEVEPPPGN